MEREYIMKKKFLYQRIYDDILEKINNGVYSENEKLPDDQELCRTYQASMITLNRALRLLAEDGYVKRVPGKGTYVKKRLLSEKNADGSGSRREEKIIGVILEHVSTPFGLEMMYQMDLLCLRAGCKMIVRFSYGERQRETEEIQFLLSLGAAGLIIMPSHGKHYNQAILRLCLNGFPVVLIDKKMKGIPVPSVRTDNREASASLVRQLAKEGYRKIAFLSTDDMEADSVKERRNGFIREMEKLGLYEAGICSVPAGITGSEWISSDPSPKVVYEIRKFLERNKADIDAVIAAEYGIVPALIRAMKMEKIEPGSQIQLACIDEDYLAPGGTSFMHVKQNEKEIAKKAVQLLLLQMDGSMGEEDDFLVPGIFCRGK